MIIDGSGLILGRLASEVAKKLLIGESIIIINAEKVVLSGGIRKSYKRYSEKLKIGSHVKGPFYSRYPDRIVKRVVRGMLPYKKDRGKNALKRLKVFINCPEKYKSEKTEKIGKTEDELRCKYTTLGDLCKKVGRYA